jgi:hypothetical protein
MFLLAAGWLILPIIAWSDVSDITAFLTRRHPVKTSYL